MNDFTKTMAPETAVEKAAEVLNLPPGGATDSVAALAGAMLIREGLVAVAKAIIKASGDFQMED